MPALQPQKGPPQTAATHNTRRPGKSKTMVISGIIRPPPEIRATADKTAAYVAKNGRAFEERILSSSRGKTPKFAFLHQSSPFHAYYEDRIQFYENGGEDKPADDDGEKKKSASSGDGKKSATDKKKGIVSVPTVRKQHKRQKASAMEPIAKALRDQRSRIAAYKAQQEKEEKLKQEKDKQSNAGDDGMIDGENDEKDQDGDDEGKPSAAALAPLVPPPPLDFVSIVAPSNLSATQIETIQLVAQFAALDGKGSPFLHKLTVREWTNPEFGFVQPRHVHFAYFSALVDAYRKIIQEWTSPQVLEGETDDADADKPVTPQMVLQDVAYRVEYERYLEENEQQEEGEIIPIDWNDFVVVETIDFPADEIVEAMLPPPPALESAGPEAESSLAAGVAAPAAAGDEMDESDDDDEGETIRVVPTYTPKVVGNTNLSGARAIDPITGKSVAVADMPEHMRIQLLDPKWAEERKKFQDKQKDSNLVSDDAIVSNINRLARAREAEDQDGKSGLSGQDEANRILREQAQGPGPSLPPPPPPPPGTANLSGRPRPGPMSGLPDPKRQRLDPNEASVPLPPPQMSQLQQGQFKVTRAPPVLPPPSGVIGAPTATANAVDNGESIGNEDATATLNEPTIASDLGVSNQSQFPPQLAGEPKQILSEQEFLATLEKPDVTLNVRVPNDPTQMAWNFYGQIVSVTVDVMTKVKDVKAELSKQHLNDMPPNKIELRDDTSGFLKNNQTLATLNIGPFGNLEMKVKQRGSGRK